MLCCVTSNCFNCGVLQVILAVLGVCRAGPFQALEATAQQAFHHNTAPVQAKWTGPVAATVPAGLPGSSPQVADTAEVAAARNAFLNAYTAQVRATAGAVQQPQPQAPTQYQPAAAALPPQQPRWTGPVAATIPAGVPGSSPQVADTPEVAAAKQAFFNTFQRQAAAAAAPSHRF